MTKYEQHQLDVKYMIKSTEMKIAYDKFLFNYLNTLVNLFRNRVYYVRGYCDLVESMPSDDLALDRDPGVDEIEKFYPYILKFELTFKFYVEKNILELLSVGFKYYYDLTTNRMLMFMIALRCTYWGSYGILSNYAERDFYNLAAKHICYIQEMDRMIKNFDYRGYRMRENMWKLFIIVDSLFISSFFLVDEIIDIIETDKKEWKGLLEKRPFTEYFFKRVVSNINGYEKENEFLLKYCDELNTMLALLYIEKHEEYKKKNKDKKVREKEEFWVPKDVLFIELVKKVSIKYRIEVYSSLVFDTFEREIDEKWISEVDYHITDNVTYYLGHLVKTPFTTDVDKYTEIMKEHYQFLYRMHKKIEPKNSFCVVKREQPEKFVQYIEKFKDKFDDLFNNELRESPEDFIEKRKK